MPDDKKNAARQVAAKFSADIESATAEYGRLTNQQDSFEFEWLNEKPVRIISKLREEMLTLLPHYRHPTWDEFAEFGIFIDPDFARFNGNIYEEPDFLSTIKEVEIPTDTIATIENYIKESERAKIDLTKNRRELMALKETFEKARRVYVENRDQRSEKRNAMVVQTLGLSTGQTPKRIDKRAAYIDYFKFVRKEGLSRQDATKKVAALHGFNSSDAALQALHSYRSAHVAKYEEQYPSHVNKIEQWLKNFIRSRRPS